MQNLEVEQDRNAECASKRRRATPAAAAAAVVHVAVYQTVAREHVLSGNGVWVWLGLRRTSSVSARLLKPLRRPGFCGAGPLSQGGVT